MPLPEFPRLDFLDAESFEAWLASQSDWAVGAWTKFAKGNAR
jgi:hypothetical protein